MTRTVAKKRLIAIIMVRGNKTAKVIIKNPTLTTTATDNYSSQYVCI